MTQNAISPTYRTTIKENHITVWTIESESGYTYTVTVFEGKVTSCQREGGTTCPGYFHRGTCHHAELVLSREANRRRAIEDERNMVELQAEMTRDEQRSSYNRFCLSMGI